jgi:hypothetical protein
LPVGRLDADHGGMTTRPHLELLRIGTSAAQAEVRRRGLQRGSTDRQRRGDYAEVLVARHVSGTMAPVNNPGFDLVCADLGRVEVKARCRDSRHLNWYHLRRVDRRGFDHLVAVELNGDWTVHDSWLLSYEEVVEYRHRRRDGRDVEPTKLAVRGAWKDAVKRLDLASTQAGLF